MTQQNEHLDNLLAELPVMVNFLKQQVQNKRISESLYVSQINRFVSLYNKYLESK
jgi:hypothetical protein